MNASAELSTSDIARARGCDPATARRWLVQLEAKHGPTVVARRGRKLFTTVAALERVVPTWRSQPDDADRVRALEERVEELEAFQRKALAWFKRVPVAHHRA